MVAHGCIPKPTFWTFSFYKKLKVKGKECVLKDKNSVVVKTDKGYAGVLWNIDGDEFTREIETPVSGSEYTLVTRTVDEECCNPLKLWHDLGEPANPSKDVVDLIRSSAYPLVQSSVIKAAGGFATAPVTVRKNGVVYFELEERTFTPDRGYDYEKVISFH